MNKEYQTPDYIIKLAQQMRRNMTRCEKILWDRIKEKKLDGYKFRRQHPVHRYILDFYCHEKRFAIEVDGDIHKERKDYDEYRDLFLQSAGIRTVRVTNKEILDDIDMAIEKIKKLL